MKSKHERKRLDFLLVERGHADTQEKAQAMILAGEVRVNGMDAQKAGAAFPADASIEVRSRTLKYASRGGFKLEGALEDFQVAARGKTCLDIGASTGGFTDCLLQQGAARVYAVDVNTDQLAWKLREDFRVVLLKRNARELQGADIPEKVDLVVADVSFISVTRVLGPALAMTADNADFLILIKPQFELAKELVGAGGIVTDTVLHEKAISTVRATATGAGLECIAVFPSRLTGAEGNQEYFLHAKKGRRVESRMTMPMTGSIKTIGIISRPRRSNLATVAPPLLQWLEAHGIRAIYDLETAGSLATGASGRTREQVAQEAEVLLVLGGDGTLLSAAKVAAPRGIPVLPINMGSLGFLTSFTIDELYPALEEMLAGRQSISERVMLKVERIVAGKVVGQQQVLNEAVVNKGALARMIEIELFIDSAYVCKYRADGLIVATPTGSTAYSVSAGGPIVHPGVGAFLITPICPHTLSDRPIVVQDSCTVELKLTAAAESVFLTLDGQTGIPMHARDQVLISRAPERLKLIQPPQKTYYELLRNKLKWGES